MPQGLLIRIKESVFFRQGEKTYRKNQIMINNRGFILHKTAHKRGYKHDYNIYKNNHPAIPKQVVNVFDLGYLGVEKDFPGQLSTLPYKKQRNQQQELYAEEKKRLQHVSF